MITGSYWVSLLIAALASASEAPPAPAWQCSEPTWEGEAGSSRGIFSSALRMECEYALGARESQPSALSTIRSRVVHLIEERKIHAGPMAAEREGLPGVKYDVSHTVLEDGSPIQFREWVWISSDQATKLGYATESIDIQAKGMAGYLREVRFSADLQPAEGPSPGLRLTLRNAVRIERPWYALDLIFAPIAKGVCREKFLKLRETVLPLLSPAPLDGTAMSQKG